MSNREQAIDILNEMIEWNVSKIEENTAKALSAKDNSGETKESRHKFEEAMTTLRKDVRASTRLLDIKGMLENREINIPAVSRAYIVSEKTADSIAEAIVNLHTEIKHEMIYGGFDDISSDILASMWLYVGE